MNIDCKYGEIYKVWSNQAIVQDKSKDAVEIMAFSLQKKSPFVIICPGGSYMTIALEIEGIPIAKRLNELGYSVFVLQYRVLKNAKAPKPIDDLAEAIRFIFKNAERFQVKADDYSVMGFSAGGHVAACFGTEKVGYAYYGLPKPRSIILAYPVITMKEYAHKWSKRLFLGFMGVRNCDLTHKWSVEEQVTNNYPPTFVWQCEYDSAVPIENSRLLVQALLDHSVVVKYETFDSDVHGLGSAEGTIAEGWIERAVEFIKEQNVNQ